MSRTHPREHVQVVGERRKVMTAIGGGAAEAFSGGEAARTSAGDAAATTPVGDETPLSPPPPPPLLPSLPSLQPVWSLRSTSPVCIAATHLKQK